MKELAAYEQFFEKNARIVKLVCYYAYRMDGVEGYELRGYARAEKVPVEEVRMWAKIAYGEGFLESSGYDWEGHCSYYAIKPEHYLPFIQYLFTHEGLGWEDDFKALGKNQRIEFPKFNRLVYNVLYKKSGIIKLERREMEYIPYLMSLYRYPSLFGLVDNMLGENVHEVIFDVLVKLMEANQIDEENGLTGMIEHWERKNKAILEGARDLVSLHRFLAYGEYQPLEPKVDFELLASSYKTLMKRMTSSRLLLETIRFSMLGNYKLATRLYGSYFKETNSDRDFKNAFDMPIFAFFHLMTLVHEGSEASLKTAAKYINDRKLSCYEEIKPTVILAHYFLDAEHRFLEGQIEQLWRGYYPINQQFANLLTHYGQLTPSDAAPLSIPLPRYAFLRHEMSAFLPLDDAERTRLKEAYGEQPMLYSLRFKPQWEYTLESLLAAKEVDSQNKTDNQTNRMMYLISYGDIEPREQSRLKSGAWSAGRAISSQRYAEGQLDCMNEVDRRIWNQYRRSGKSHLTPEIVLPELVGTDRLYYGYYAPYEPVKVTLEKPYLTIEKGKDCFTVRANYQAPKNGDVYESSTHIVTRRNNTEYLVTPISGVQRRFFDGLLRIGRFPLEAEAQLKAFFPQVSDLIEVHSTTFTEGNTLETVPGDSTLYLQASPSEESFHVRIVVRPLAGGKAVFAPGRGSVLIPDEADGKRVQVQRQMKEEKRKMAELTALLGEITESELTGNEAILSVEDMLNLVEQFRGLDSYVIEWEEGKQLNLKKTAKMDRWNVSLRRQGGWFELEGEICLDDDTVLSMAQLLELIGQNRGEYVRLNDRDYLHLSDNLRRQLARLEAASVQQRGKVEIPALTAGLLSQDALQGEFNVQTDESLQQLRDRIGESRQLTPKVPAKLQATLRDYQEDGFRWIARLNHWGAGACLADDMGLGKTVQTIAYLLYIAKEGASLVVAPASVVPNWKRELARFAPSLHVSVLNESADRAATIRDAKARHIVVSTYGLLVSESEAILQKQWNVVCLDEAHTIKNRETKTSAVAMQMQAAHRLILTGTPVQNHLGELWNLFQFINPGLLGSYEQFQHKFIMPIEIEHDKQRQQQLNRLVHPFMLRRTKREVVEELPDKEEIVLPVEMSDDEMSIYEVIRRKAKEMVAEGGAKVNVATLAQITKLRQAACCAELVEPKWKGGCSKIDRLVDLMTELRENGHRALVFSQFTSFFNLVRRSLDKAGIEYLYLDGSVTLRRRQQLVDEFQEGDCPFFLISLKAGGLGLNLTGANYIIHLDPWWNPAIEEQATDRAYRIGQKQKVTAYHLVAAHTIEEKILRLHTSKRNLSDALLAGTDMSHKLSAKDLMDILEAAEEEE